MGRSKSVVLEAHAAQDGLGPRLELVAVDALEGGLQGAQLVQQLLGVDAASGGRPALAAAAASPARRSPGRRVGLR